MIEFMFEDLTPAKRQTVLNRLTVKNNKALKALKRPSKRASPAKKKLSLPKKAPAGAASDSPS
eukprot:3940844-Rhodomonas_salina.9